jgi:protein-S-isoprenylcysteine O-methyltransferase Ste14
LVVHGLYRHTRHPIYSGLLLYAAGSILVHTNPVSVAAGGVLLVLLMAKARWEESMLISAMPGYRQYARRTGRFTPDLGRLRG